ncbi:MAG TPA: cyclase family protein [Xanthobacteraceae bacterium]|nr:cyclase family protein [Xanthobacteraceae bacterium]
MRRFIIRAACAGALLAGLAGAPWRSATAQGWMPPPPEQRCPSVWGAADERGAANLQTAESVLAAARLIRDGKTYELGKVLDGTIPMSPGRTFALNVQRTSGPNGRNQQGGNEETVFTELGQMGTQFDGLAHQQLGPYLYNCVETEKVVRRGGFTKLGVEKAGSFFARGVLLDIAALKGVDMLPDDYMITVADIEAAMTRQNVEVRKGDAVLIRTGWGRLWTVDNARFIKGEPGIGLEAAEFLVKRNVMMVGSDNWAVEVRPYPDRGLFLPVHGYLLNVNGIYLIENLDLEALARDKANEFAFIVAPLKLRGGTGSSVAPIAVK